MSDTAVNESDAAANRSDMSTEDSAPMGKRKRAPRRILHFSDGTLEEYSSEEDEPDHKNVTQVSNVDPRGLEWGPWLFYQASVAGSRTLEVCDYLGESLANFFGITTPKYQYEIEEYHRMVAEEEEAQKKMDLEMGGWSSPNDLKLGPVNEQQQVIPQRLWTHGQQGSAV